MNYRKLSRLHSLLQKLIKDREYLVPTNYHALLNMEFVVEYEEELKTLLKEFLNETQKHDFDSIFGLTNHVMQKIVDRRKRSSHSEVLTFRKCRLKHFLKYKWKLKPKWQEREHYFVLGSWLHDALEEMYKIGHDNVTDEIMDRIVSDFEYPDDFEMLSDEQQEQLRINKAIAEGMARAYYLTIFQNEKGVILDSRPEQRIQVPLKTPSGRKSTKFTYLCYLDNLLKFHDGRWYLHEVKTMSSIGDQVVEHLEIDEQLSKYLWALEQEGYEIAGVFYTMFKKPGIQPRQRWAYYNIENERVSPIATKNELKAMIKSGELEVGVDWNLEKTKEATDDYCKRVVEDYIERPEFYIQREMVHRTEDQIRGVEKRIYLETKACAENNEDTTYPQVAPHYNNYCSRCEYRPVCRYWYEPIIRNELIEENFTNPEDRFNEQMQSDLKRIEIENNIDNENEKEVEKVIQELDF